ncbi:septal ring lytic transglycosylase RlpA family protein [Solitalea canadensis]|uniref:Probable endolytic peptidoglycan transglycosylase RlpA n=1 Tax=Solitalea canadensis (strain ATCC 29591 / DSM 3403 / JCM 21819 / LMG 8368 / NBRC 15130 / NCIMB 12057 / USAM 9D) TaxID=929556 RepID=H8KLJ8_SOLCM|nr:septal ring lytic transglycosylase RlpA family protein [Solitalea canadensis]AFD08885.1 rare lipoprotein A [Solitalea canadensis DSM 3403]
MKSKYTLVAAFVLTAMFIGSCAPKITESGRASYYGNKFEGRKTASGEKYKAAKLTAAHKTLPFGTTVKVKNLDNGKVVKVVVNDRGPFVAGRIIDVSGKAAKQLDMQSSGTAKVEIKYKKPRRSN